jgi:hypothetical protein
LEFPLSLERRTFNTSVNVENGSVIDTIFPKTSLTSADWDAVLDVGKIRLSANEIARMPAGSAYLYKDGDGYAGNLEVFHEMHCLVS